MGLFKDTPRDYTPAVPAAFSVPRPLTAAAARVKMKDKSEAEQFRQRRSSGTAQWQAEAWDYYDAIGEIKYAFNLVASVISRIRLYAAVIDDPAEAPMPIKFSDKVDPLLADAAERALSRLDSAYGGQAGLLRDAALNLSVAGECYLVQIPARQGSGIPESWDIRSIDELQVNTRGTYSIAPRRDLVGTSKKGLIELPETAFVGRLWRAHPRFSEEPDSSLKGLLDLCSELLLLNRSFRAVERSRLNAGLLYIPDGLSTAAAPDPDYPYDESGETPQMIAEEAADEFEENLIDAMSTPIEDESSASSIVPLVVRGPVELGEKIRHIKFERSYDATMIQRADRVLERILQGLDVPKDTVTGLANVKYSNAVQIDESLYKAHIEPMLLLISDAITVAFLRPYLMSLGYSQAEVQNIVVWYDPSAVATRNDRAQDADSGFDKMAISFDTWRRAHGFADADAPDPTELAMRILLEKGSITPELSEAILSVVSPEIISAARQASQAQSVAPVPPEAQEILNGAQATPGAPTDPAAPAEGDPALAEPGAAPTDAPVEPQVTPEEPVAPGDDAPPFPLAEPTS